MMVSDSPPACPVTQREYESAVSIRLKPEATKASSSRNDIASSAVQPNTLPPNANGATSKPVLPSLRFSMSSFPLPAPVHRLGQLELRSMVRNRRAVRHSTHEIIA